MSAPYSSMSSFGGIALPSDFDILRPVAATTKPCVKILRYGARPCIAQPVKSDD